MGKLMIYLIRLYQKYLSGLKRMPTCRFIPTCSEYAVEAIRRHGALCGGVLAVWRVLRCNPLGKTGYDPVPEHILFKRKEKN